MLKARGGDNATSIACTLHSPEDQVPLEQVVVLNHNTSNPRQDTRRRKRDDLHLCPFGIHLQQVNRTSLGKFEGLCEANTFDGRTQSSFCGSFVP